MRIQSLIFFSHFVPNLTIGAIVVKALRKYTDAYLDCHLMVSCPDFWIKSFRDAGASQFTFHIEAVKKEQVADICEAIRHAKMHVGISLKPATPVSEIAEYVRAGLVDTVLVMSVEPGFGGQAFMPEVIPKISELRAISKTVNISVDGGISPQNSALVAAAGANVLVAGSSIFGAEDPTTAIKQLRQSLEENIAARQ